jgi:hypothetical protein
LRQVTQGKTARQKIIAFGSHTGPLSLLHFVPRACIDLPLRKKKMEKMTAQHRIDGFIHLGCRMSITVYSQYKVERSLNLSTVESAVHGVAGRQDFFDFSSCGSQISGTKREAFPTGFTPLQRGVGALI